MQTMEAASLLLGTSLTITLVVLFFRIHVREQKLFSVRQWTMRKQRPSV